jgi:hypothetical protein
MLAGGLGAVSAVSAQAAVYPGIIDLGANVNPTGRPAVVDGHYEVPVSSSSSYGLWVDGTVEAMPAAPAADPGAHFEPDAINANGVLVGTTSTSRPAYWDSLHANQFVEVPVSGLTVNGQPGATGRLNAIDAAGEAVGQVVDGSGAASADYAGLFVAAAGNLPAGPPQVVTSLGSNSMFSLGGISATWEQGPASGNAVGYVDYNRQTQDATATGFEGLEGPGGGFADTGLIAGYLSSNGGNAVPYLYRPGAGNIGYQSPSDSTPFIYDLNGGGETVGYAFPSSGSNSPGETWDINGNYTPLLSQVATAGGWTVLHPSEIDDGYDIAGTGTLNGQAHGFLLEAPSRASKVSVRCLPQTTGSLVDTCVITVADGSGQSPALTPTGTVTVTATGGGTIAGGGTCGLAADATDSNASCSVAYTPPANVAAATAAPIVTGTYPGDATFAPGAGSEALDCTSGGVFQATAITSSDPSTNGFRVGSPVTLQGCGFTAATVVDFGSTGAEATPTAVSSDGKTLTVTVPPYAISGPVTVVDKTFITTRTTTLTAPDPVTIDSWRNTNGFSFPNFHGAITAADLLTEYPKSGLTLTPGSTTLQQWAASFLDDAQKAAKTGLCFGLALASGEVADGYLSPTVFGFTANSAYDLSRTATFDRYMGQLWLAQVSDQALPYKVEATRTGRGQAAIEAELAAAMGGPNGFTHPALINIYAHQALAADIGHTEVAYGYTMSDGVLTIETDDSNLPFTAAEDSDTTDSTHEKALGNSWITVDASGKWDAHGEPMKGIASQLEVVPVKALQRSLTISPRSIVGGLVSVLVGATDSVDGVSNASGHPDNLYQDSSALQVIPQITASARPVAEPASRPLGLAGVSQLLIGGSASTVTLSSTGTPIAGLWRGTTGNTSVTAGSGALSVGFGRTTGTTTLAPVAHAHAPRSATVTVTRLDGAVDHVVTVTGTAHVAVAVSGSGAVDITSPAGGHETVTLSVFGHGVGVQSAVLGTVDLRAGQTLALHPRSWSQLATTSFAATVSAGHRPARRLRLRNHLRPPRATVRRASVHGRVLRLTVRVPALTAGQATVSATITATAHGRVQTRASATVPAGGRSRTETVTVRLKRTLAAGSRLAVTLTTINGGTAATEAASSYAKRV